MGALTRLRKALEVLTSEEDEPEPVAVPGGLVILPRLYREDEVEQIRREERRKGQAMAYEAIRAILLAPLPPDQQVQRLHYQILSIDDFERLYNPYEKPGRVTQFYQQKQIEGPTQEMKSVASPKSNLGVPRLMSPNDDFLR